MNVTSGRLRQLGFRQRNGEAAGIYSVCSAHRVVLETAMIRARDSGSELLVEATCNQVNPCGGYTGMTPADFAGYVKDLAGKTGFSAGRLNIGGDHLGPYPWRDEPSEQAMEKARALVSDCVAAGYAKLHLDAGMPLGGEEGAFLPMEISAARTADLCRAAEDARSDAQRISGEPVYVIGAEAPSPGGSLEEAGSVEVTPPDSVGEFLDLCRREFKKYGIDDVWPRVVAVVVQPGVDFGIASVESYDSEKARDLSDYHRKLPGMLTYEVHGTDFQLPDSLSKMVADHFSILKAGPVLTFAFREAVFGLAGIEAELLGRKKGIRLSRIREVLETQMQRHPGFWKSHCSGDDSELSWKRAFGFLDRVRYYWRNPAVDAAFNRLVSNLDRPVPLPLLSQYLPGAYPAVRRGEIPAEPLPLVRHRISAALLPYARACRNKQI